MSWPAAVFETAYVTIHREDALWPDIGRDCTKIMIIRNADFTASCGLAFALRFTAAQWNNDAKVLPYYSSD